MNDLKKLLLTGGVLRYRPALGFYIVLSGKSIPVSVAVGKKAVQEGLVRPDGMNEGAYIFVFNANHKNSAASAVSGVRGHSQALPARPANARQSLPELRSLRGPAYSANTARVPVAGGKKAGGVSAGAGRLAGAGAQRKADPGAGQGRNLGGGGVKQ